MLEQLFFANLHFTVKIFSALIFFATFWLHLGSWQIDKKEKRLLVRSLGFLALCAVSVSQATSIELDSFTLIFQVIEVFGLLHILISLLRESILRPPEKESLAIPYVVISQILIPFSAILYLAISFVYLLKSTKGYEKQMKPLFLAFFLISVSEFINASFFAADTQIVFLSKALSEFGPLWIISTIIEIIGMIILGIWTWGYLRFRIQAQLFIIFVSSSLVIFAVTTFSFTFLLLKNLERDALAHIRTDVNVLNYAIERLQSESISNARVVSESSLIKENLKSGDKSSLFDNSLEYMLSQNSSFLNIVDLDGKVITRAEDEESVGDSLSSDFVVKQALGGISEVTVAIKGQQIAPGIQIRASVPIVDANQTIGAVISGFDIDSAFVDGVKEVTGLDVSIFAGDTRAATTFVSTDGKSRFIGTKGSNESVLSTVLTNGQMYAGSSSVLNKPYLTAYSPLRTADDQIVGMLFVGKLQTELFDTARRSIQITFLMSTILMIISTFPAYFLARYIKSNLKA